MEIDKNNVENKTEDDKKIKKICFLSGLFLYGLPILCYILNKFLFDIPPVVTIIVAALTLLGVELLVIAKVKYPNNMFVNKFLIFSFVVACLVISYFFFRIWMSCRESLLRCCR